MRYAICNETFEGWDHDRVCRAVAEQGYQGLEIALYSNNVGDESYIVFDGPSTRRWNLPRTYGAQLRYKW